jgi:hypothetical protein
VFTDLAFNPVELRASNSRDTYVPLVEQRLMLHVGAELGIGGRGALAVRLPIVLYQDAGGSGRDRQVFSVTDPQLWLRYRLLGADMDDRNEPHDGPALLLQLGAAFPLARDRPDLPVVSDLPGANNHPFVTDEAVRSEVALVGDFQLLGAAIGGSVGYRHHFWNTRGPVAATTAVSEELTFGAALKVPIPPVPALKAILELRGASGFRSARDTQLELALGGRLSVGDIVIALAGALGLSDGVGTPDARILFGVYGVLARHDQDGDGIDDADDKCAFLAEDVDGFQDDDGCPDPDNDGDLVPDLDDKCPSVAAEEGRDEDEDGCTDPAPAGAGQE